MPSCLQRPSAKPGNSSAAAALHAFVRAWHIEICLLKEVVVAPKHNAQPITILGYHFLRARTTTGEHDGKHGQHARHCKETSHGCARGYTAERGNLQQKRVEP